MGGYLLVCICSLYLRFGKGDFSILASWRIHTYMPRATGHRSRGQWVPVFPSEEISIMKLDCLAILP